MFSFAFPVSPVSPLPPLFFFSLTTSSATSAWPRSRAHHPRAAHRDSHVQMWFWPSPRCSGWTIWRETKTANDFYSFIFHPHLIATRCSMQHGVCNKKAPLRGLRLEWGRRVWKWRGLGRQEAGNSPGQSRGLRKPACIFMRFGVLLWQHFSFDQPCRYLHIPRRGCLLKLNKGSFWHAYCRF